jgi:hypothetical protein
LFVAVVVILAFLLLMLMFRSLMIPAMASLMNLLSVDAALGVMNAVFGWGWSSSILGISGTALVEAFLPALMFSVHWSESGAHRHPPLPGPETGGRGKSHSKSQRRQTSADD